MKRSTLWVLAVIAAVAVLVAVQAVISSRQSGPDGERAALPGLAAGSEALAGLTVVPDRRRGYDYVRSAFGEAWTDEQDAPGGRNGCDTRNDVLDRDLVDKTYVRTGRCPRAVATGVLRDPYTNATVHFLRGSQTGGAVQIDHIVPLAYAWDMGARDWPWERRVRFANDPANLLAVEGQANQDKGDQPPARWMPPNEAFHCQYARQFIEVLRGYELPVDASSVPALRDATASCPE